MRLSSLRPASRGGSLIFSASMLELLGGDGIVVGVDVDIRGHNRVEIEPHPRAKRIRMTGGSSIDEGIVRGVVLVLLDSNHAHVLRELELYSSLVTQGGYLIVYDTVVKEMPEEMYLTLFGARRQRAHCRPRISRA